MGTATNGAGTLQGLVLDPVASGYVTGVGNSANSAAPAQFAHSTGIGYALLNFGLAMLATAGSTTDWSHPGFYIIERTRDASGNPTAEGVGLTYGATSTASIFSDKAINFATGIVYGTARNPHCGAPATSYSVSTGDEVALFRHHIGMGKLVPAMARLGYYTTDIAAGTTFTAAAVGATPRTYFAWPPLVGSDSARSTSISLAYLWED